MGPIDVAGHNGECRWSSPSSPTQLSHELATAGTGPRGELGRIQFHFHLARCIDQQYLECTPTQTLTQQTSHVDSSTRPELASHRLSSTPELLAVHLLCLQHYTKITVASSSYRAGLTPALNSPQAQDTTASLASTSRILQYAGIVTNPRSHIQGFVSLLWSARGLFTRPEMSQGSEKNPADRSFT